MSEILLIAGEASSVPNFRGDLIAAMRARGHSVAVIAPACDEPLQTQIKALGVSFYPIPLARTKMSLISDARAFVSLARLIRRLNPDCILAYTIKPVIYGLLAARLAGVHKRFALITGRGYVFTSLAQTAKGKILQRLIIGLYRLALNGVTAVIFQNPDDQDFFNGLGIAEGALSQQRVNGSGVNLTRFSPTSLPAAPVFLMVARLLRDKGIFEYIAAARQLKTTRPQAKCILVGPLDPNPSSLTQEDLQTVIAEGVIDYRGALADVRPALAEASVYVLPSYREGTPRSTLEALASARPVITTDAPGCRETVQDGVNGLLVPVGDAAALASAMEKLADDGDLRTSMGQQSLALAREKFDVDKINQSMIEIMRL